jgi:uncharacterized protein (TIGR02466 family)
MKSNIDEDSVLDFGLRSLNTYILNESPCLELSKYILNQTLIYSTEYLGYDYLEYKFTQSWISHKRPGEEHVPHTHPNSLISGILYYGNYDKNTPGIIIQKPSQNHNLIPKLSENPSSNSYFTSPYFPYDPSPGDLLLFPSYLPHMVPKNNSNKTRKSLAFNIVPTEGFGVKEHLTELKFN